MPFDSYFPRAFTEMGIQMFRTNCFKCLWNLER